MKTLEVVDAHFHLWDHATGNYAKPAGPFDKRRPSPPRAASYLLEDFLVDAAAVTLVGAVHVEAIAIDPLAETRYVATAASQCAFPVAISAHVDLTAADRCARLDAHAAAAPNLAGIRQILNRHPDPTLNFVDVDCLADPALVEGLRELGRRNLLFELQIYPRQMMDAVRVARSAPDTRFVLNHAGMWDERTLSGWQAWRRGLRALAALPNVSVKISGLCKFDRRWTLESYRPIVFEVLEHFGVERAMFASNFAVDKASSDYLTVWRAFADSVAGLTDAEQAALLRHNATRSYRLAA